MGRKKAALKELVGVPSIDILLPMLEYLDIDVVEYCLCFLIDRLGHNSRNKSGWCYASKEHLSRLTRQSRATTYRTIDRLVSIGLVLREDSTGNLSITEKWMDALDHFSELRKNYMVNDDSKLK